jgi:transposase
VGLTRQAGANVSQIARDLDIGANLIHRWQRELEAHGNSSPHAQSVMAVGTDRRLF